MPLSRKEKLQCKSSISQQLQQILKADGRRISELAETLGVDRSQLSHFINGTKGMSLKTFDKIAVELGLKLERKSSISLHQQEFGFMNDENGGDNDA